MSEYVFAAPWARSVWVLTFVIGGIVAAESVVFMIVGEHLLRRSWIAGSLFLAIGALTVLSIIIFAFFAPIRYGIGVEGVTVYRLGSNVRIPLNDISEVTEVALGKTTRTFGVGGLFGFWGMFSSGEIGDFRAYLTRTDGVILIRRKTGEPVAISPDDPLGFITAIRSVLAAGERQG